MTTSRLPRCLSPESRSSRHSRRKAHCRPEESGCCHKPGSTIYNASTGSPEAAAAASGAPLTLLDTPFAALDAASARVLADVLAEAAEDTARAWVVADHEIPAVLQGVALAGVIDLGD